MTVYYGDLKRLEHRYCTYTFEKDGKFFIELTMNCKRIVNGIDRRWVLHQDGEASVIEIINGPSHFEVVAADKKSLVIRNLTNKIIVHFEKQW